MPANLGEVLRAYDKVVVPEMNLGQLAILLQARYLVESHSYSRVRGLPISLSELEADLIAEIDALQEESLMTDPASSGVPLSHLAADPEGLHQRTRRCAGAPAAATTPSWPPSSR